MNDVKVRFLHPSDGNTIAVSIPEGVKVKEGVNQLIRNGFLPQCKDGYVLSCEEGNVLDMDAIFTESELKDGAAISIQQKSEGHAASDGGMTSSDYIQTPEPEIPQPEYPATATASSISNNESLDAIWMAVRQLEEKQINTIQAVEHIKNQATITKSAESYEDIYMVIRDLKKIGGVKIPNQSILNKATYIQLALIAGLSLTAYLINYSPVAMQWLYRLIS